MREGARVLRTPHRKRGRGRRLGEPAEGETAFATGALTEAQEESGLADLVLEDGEFFALDRHWIPEHKGVPAHWHYDVRFVIRAMESQVFVVSDESHALAWRAIASLVDDDGADASLRRMARKWLQREDAGSPPSRG